MSALNGQLYDRILGATVPCHSPHFRYHWGRLYPLWGEMAVSGTSFRSSRWIYKEITIWLVVSNMNFIFHNTIYWDNPEPSDFHIFQRGRSTTNQCMNPVFLYDLWFLYSWPTLRIYHGQDFSVKWQFVFSCQGTTDHVADFWLPDIFIHIRWWMQ